MENKEIINWDNTSQIQEIKKIFAPNLSNEEFQIFVGVGKATGLNPFLKEIRAVKYGNQAAQIFIGRDGYRKGAQRNPEYEYHTADSVFANDEFRVVNGEVEHKYNVANRGKLVGAYCITKRQNASKTMYHYVDFVEYYQGRRVIENNTITNKIKKNKYGSAMGDTLRDTKPATMIKKVAEAQGLRQAFQEMFAGTYDETEAWKDDQRTNNVQEAEIVEENNNDELKKIRKSIQENWKLYAQNEKYSQQESKNKFLENLKQRFGVSKGSELSLEQAQEFNSLLESINK